MIAARPKEATKKTLDTHFKTDASGRMHITEEVDSTANDREEDGDMGAYLEAMRGEDGHTRDAKGKARFNKTQGKRARGNDDEDVAMTEGLKELDVRGGGGGKSKKVKRETVKIGAEFKAKVRRCSSSFIHLPFSGSLLPSRWARDPFVGNSQKLTISLAMNREQEEMSRKETSRRTPTSLYKTLQESLKVEDRRWTSPGTRKAEEARSDWIVCLCFFDAGGLDRLWLRNRLFCILSFFVSFRESSFREFMRRSEWESSDESEET